MAKNNNVKNKNEKKQEKKFVNPASRPWGKVIIAILAILMALGSLISLIYLIVQNILY